MYAAEMAKREQVRKAHRVHAARKQRERRRTVLILLVTLISIFIIGVGFGTMLAKAQEPEKSTSEKYYRSICVEKGDTLWDIASEYMDSVYYASHAEYMKEIREINHISPNGQIISGQTLIIPYYAEDTE